MGVRLAAFASLIPLSFMPAIVQDCGGYQPPYAGLTDRAQIGCYIRSGSTATYPTGDGRWHCGPSTVGYWTCVDTLDDDVRFAGYVNDACRQGEGVFWWPGQLGYI